MTVSWKSWSNLFCICLLLFAAEALAQDFHLAPVNLTVLQGTSALFRAKVTGKWEVMTWTVGKLLVLTVSLPNGNSTSFPGQYSSRFCSSADTSCVEFIIHNVNRNQSGSVDCAVQGDYGQRTAQLNIQESGTVSIMGGNLTVEQDQQVEFQCVATAWFPIPTVSWNQNGQAVNSSLYNTTSMADGDSINSTSVLKFQAVSNTTVECQATVSELKDPQSSSVFLVVVPKPPDWTVLIAVVVSFGSLALLVLLIIGIIFCYKRRKEKQRNYQDEMSKRVRTQSQSVASAAGQKQGQVNAGYVADGRTSVTPSDLTDSGFGQVNGSNSYEMPDVVNSNQAGNGYNSTYNTVDDSGFRKHRHVTIV
ncbi:immunoglobulin superfamily member 5 [Seriola aureovittata]|uniref:immunoglobulin superfamily member 5 n=1 Tax=Seriola aureovittata TaxID=2871759 RepID=UPI0024BE778D|nr:immunoglobulin superfamily member 5 [Seriola aureovittata]